MKLPALGNTNEDIKINAHERHSSGTLIAKYLKNLSKGKCLETLDIDNGVRPHVNSVRLVIKSQRPNTQGHSGPLYQ